MNRLALVGRTPSRAQVRLGRSQIEVTIRTVMMIDSLEITDTDRALIVQNCLQSEEKARKCLYLR